jgi:hypothetical protein
VKVYIKNKSEESKHKIFYEVMGGEKKKIKKKKKGGYRMKGNTKYKRRKNIYN